MTYRSFINFLKTKTVCVPRIKVKDGTIYSLQEWENWLRSFDFLDDEIINAEITIVF